MKRRSEWCRYFIPTVSCRAPSRRLIIASRHAPVAGYLLYWTHFMRNAREGAFPLRYSNKKNQSGEWNAKYATLRRDSCFLVAGISTSTLIRRIVSEHLAYLTDCTELSKGATVILWYIQHRENSMIKITLEYCNCGIDRHFAFDRLFVPYVCHYERGFIPLIQ